MSTTGVIPTLDDVHDVLGQNLRHPVLLYIDKGRKGPVLKGWQKTTYEQTQTDFWQKLLRQFSNTGVLLGGAENLCAFDCDTETYFAEWINLNPAFASTLISQGEKGGQFWAYVTGKRPQKVEPLHCDPGSALAIGAKIDQKTGLAQLGEFRAEDGQSVIRGIHPSGCQYKWLCPNPPITIKFDSVIWPTEIITPWGRNRRAQQKSVGSKTDDSLLARAIDALSIDLGSFQFCAANWQPGLFTVSG